MDDVTPEQLERALYDGLQSLAGQPFDRDRTKKALVNAALAVVPPDYDSPIIFELDDGDYRVELVTNDAGMPAVKLTPIEYTFTITVPPEDLNRNAKHS